jgi:tRNA dimethylallyltransferase
LFSYFLNHLTLQKAVDSIKGHTRQYARRQLTWFRRDREMQWFQPGDTQDILSYIYDKIEE